MKIFLLASLLLSTGNLLQAQSMNLYTKDVLKKNRDKFFRNAVNNTINNNLQQPLNEENEEAWQNAFYAVALVNYRSALVDKKVEEAVQDMARRSPSFQRSLLELLNVRYDNLYIAAVKRIADSIEDAKTFCMALSYILGNGSEEDVVWAEAHAQSRLYAENNNPYYQQLFYQASVQNKKLMAPSIKTIFQKDYLPGQLLLVSLQRKNRNFPGIVLIRDGNGRLIKINDSTIFSVSQLARSLSNMPGYISNGNTPEGIYRMAGFDVSRSSFIGPSVNIQLRMPFEDKASHFYNDSSKTDSVWTKEDYASLLPPGFKNYYPAYQTYYAGMVGRTEIIAHGSTVNPAFYQSQKFHPFTPTAGCLCTKEDWNELTGKLNSSDQFFLVDTLRKTGGANGYALVINIDDKEEAVSPAEVLQLLR